MDEPLADKEWLARYPKKQEENKKSERELKKRLENHVLSSFEDEVYPLVSSPLFNRACFAQKRNSEIKSVKV